MTDIGRNPRAIERRRRAIITRHALDDGGPDTVPVRGPDAISLVTRLTREAWSLSGRPWPDYDRASTSYRFRPGFPE